MNQYSKAHRMGSRGAQVEEKKMSTQAHHEKKIFLVKYLLKSFTLSITSTNVVA